MRPEELYKEFMKFMNKSDIEFADFFITRTGQQKLETLVGKKNSKQFDVIGAHSSHSLICFWQIQEGVSVNHQPVVWLDSEGSPNSVFAPNIEGFISLLPYDTGVIYDIISAWLFHKEDPEDVPSPRKKFTSNKLQNALSSAEARYEGYETFLKWLEKDVNLQICEDPVDLIGKSIESYPELSIE